MNGRLAMSSTTRPQIEALVEQHVGQKVQRDVEEGEQAQLAADARRPRPAEQRVARACRPGCATRKTSAARPSSFSTSAIGLAPSVARASAVDRPSTPAAPSAPDEEAAASATVAAARLADLR